MAAEDHAGGSQPDYTALRILGALGFLEVGLLYVLIAVETPFTPIVQRLLRNPAGVFTLVMIVVTMLLIGMALVLGLAEKYRPPTDRDPAS